MTETTPDAAEEAFALQTRAQALKVISADDAERNGEEDRIEVGSGGFNDAVIGEDKLRVGGDLHEVVRGTRQLSAARVENTIRGNATMRFKEYGTIMAGVMQEKHLNGSLLLAGMSDDLVGGGGVRLTTAVDLWAGNLVGIEEKPGTVCADGILAEAFVKMFEREYGAAVHQAGMAMLSGNVRTTTASGLWPLNRVSNGVRQLNPGGGGGGGSGAAPPAAAPPPVPVGAVGGIAAMAAFPRAIRAGSLLTDLSSLDSARHLAELQNAAGLENAADIARSLEEFSQNIDDIGSRAEDVETLRRLTDADPELAPGMLAPATDPRAMNPDELAAWRRQNDADDWLTLLSGAAPRTQDGVTQADDAFKGVVPATMAEADEMLAEVRRGLMPDGFDFNQSYTDFENARAAERVNANFGAYLALTGAHNELLDHSKVLMAALIRHAGPEEARRLSGIENLAERRAAMVTAIEEARLAGDIARVVELESLLIGFDATAMRLMEQATASADILRSLPTPRLPAGVNKDELLAGMDAEIARLTRLHQASLDPTEQQQLMDQISMYMKAQDMIARGEDPRGMLRDEAAFIRHSPQDGFYPNRSVIYGTLTLDVIAKIEDLVKAQGIQLDELQSLEDILAAHRLRPRVDGHQAAAFDDIIALEDVGQSRRAEFVESPAAVARAADAGDARMDYASLSDLTALDADTLVRTADAPPSPGRIDAPAGAGTPIRTSPSRGGIRQPIPSNQSPRPSTRP